MRRSIGVPECVYCGATDDLDYNVDIWNCRDDAECHWRAAGQGSVDARKAIILVARGELADGLLADALCGRAVN